MATKIKNSFLGTDVKSIQKQAKKKKQEEQKVKSEQTNSAPSSAPKKQYSQKRQASSGNTFLSQNTNKIKQGETRNANYSANKQTKSFAQEYAERKKNTSLSGLSAKDIRDNSTDLKQKYIQKDSGSTEPSRITDLTTGTFKQIVGGHATSFGRDSNEHNEDVKRFKQMYNEGKISKQTLDANLKALDRSSTKAKKYEGWQDTKLHKGFQKLENYGKNLNAQGDEEVERGTKGLGTGGRIVAGAYTSGLGMASDLLFGPAWFASMVSRTYGNEYNSVRNMVEGKDATISELEAERYAGGQAMKEAATEGLFKGIGLAGEAVGAGALTKGLTSTIAKSVDKSIMKIGNKTLRNATAMGSRILGGSLEEAAEEVIAGVLEPFISNATIYHNVSDRSVNDMLNAKSKDINRQIQPLADAMGVDTDRAKSILAQSIMSYESMDDTVDKLVKNGMSEEEARSLSKDIQRYLVARLNGDENAEKLKGIIQDKMYESSPLKQKISPSDILEAALSAALMTSVTGAPGVVQRNSIGKNIKAKMDADEQFKKNFFKIADSVNDKYDRARLKAMSENEGEASAIQLAEAYEMIGKSIEEDHKNAVTASRTASMESIAAGHNFAPAIEVSADGTLNSITGEFTQQRIEQTRESANQFVKDAVASVEDTELDDDEAKVLAENLVKMEIGAADYLTLSQFAEGNDVARAAYQNMFGEELPTDNKELKDYLLQKSMANYKSTAEKETGYTIDTSKGIFDKSNQKMMRGAGAAAYENATAGVSVFDPKSNARVMSASRYRDYTNALMDAYKAGKNNSDIASVKQIAENYNLTEVNPRVMEEVENLYQAGRTDSLLTIGKGNLETTSRFDAKVNEGAIAELSASDKNFYRTLADNLGVNIEIDFIDRADVENMKSRKAELQEDGNISDEQFNAVLEAEFGEGMEFANGSYTASTNTITINMSNDIRTNVAATITHEMVHAIKMWNPEAYEKFAKLYKERYLARDREGYMKALQQRALQYGKAKVTKSGQVLVTDEAYVLEEMIADSMFEILQDRDFVESVCRDENLAFTVLESIRKVMRAIRDMFALGQGYRRDQNLALLSELDILKEAESMMLNGINASYSAKAEETLDQKLPYNITKKRVVVEDYSEKQKENWKNSKRIVLCENSNQLREFVKKYQKGADKYEIMYLGKITKDFADEIYNETGIKLEGYNLAVSSYEVRKIEKSHGDSEKEAERGQRAVVEDDYVNLVDTITNCTDIEVDQNGYEGHPLIRFIKEESEKITIAAYAVSDHRDLRLQTMYINVKNAQKRSLATAVDEQASTNTPEATSGTASRKRLSLSDAEVNIKSTDPFTFNDSGDRIPLSERFDETKNDTRWSKDSSETDAQGRTLSEGQAEFFRNVAPELRDENGNIKRYYHGTARMDRVGNIFDPARATSGPMAFFTDNPEIAENYSKSKSDTSLKYDENAYYMYEDQFRTKSENDEDTTSFIDVWRYLPKTDRDYITERAGHTHYDWDDYETLVYDEETNDAGGGFTWQLKEAKGNTFRALVEQWLNSGNLFGEEAKFKDVLDFVGVNEILNKNGYEDVIYFDPNYTEEGVFEQYLRVENPLLTTALDEEFADDLVDWLDATDLSMYEVESASTDFWDKNDVDPYDFAERVRADIENGTTHAWTSIPDAVTDFLKDQGYDGIVDEGGKHGGLGHQVVIPFSSEQVKDIDNLNPTENPDKRFSISENKELLKEKYDVYKEDESLLNLAADAITEPVQLRFNWNESEHSVRRNTSGIRTLGIGISTEFINKGYIDFRGRKVRSPEELALAMQVCRDNRYETFRVVLVKGDKIVSVRNITSRLPGVSAASETDSIQNDASMLIDRMKRSGADGYYLVHNHPSGDVTASLEDKRTTATYIQKVPGFKGHAILDHNKYGLIEDIPEKVGDMVLPSSSEKGLPDQGMDFMNFPETEHPLLGKSVLDGGSLSPDIIADCIKSIQGEDSITLIYLTSKGVVREIQEIDNNVILNQTSIDNYIRNEQTRYGSRMVVAGTSSFKMRDRLNKLVEDSVVLDAFILDGDYAYSSRIDDGVIPSGPTEDDLYKSRKRVFEEALGYPDTRLSLDSDGNELTPQQAEFFKDSKARDEDGRLVPLYHTTDKGGFVVFDPQYSADRRSLFFASNRNVSASYSRSDSITEYNKENLSSDDAETIGQYKVYLNLTNPLVVDGKGAEWNRIPFYNGAEMETAIDIVNERYAEIESQFKNGDIDKWGYLSEIEDLPGTIFEILSITKGIDSGDATMHYSFKGKARNKETGEWESFNEVGSATDVSSIFNNLLGSDDAYEQMVDALSDSNGEVTLLGAVAFDNNAWNIANFELKFGAKLPKDYATTRMISRTAYEAGHDGVIIRNVFDIGPSGMDVYESSDIYIAFSPEQIKLTDNETPTNVADIRFSVASDNNVINDLLDDPSLQEGMYGGTAEQRQRKADTYSAAAAIIDSYLANEKRLTHDKVLNVKDKDFKKAVSDIVDSLMSSTSNTTAEKNAVKKRIADVAQKYYLILRDLDINKKTQFTTRDICRYIQQECEEIIDSINFVDSDMYRQYKQMREYFRTVRLYVPQNGKDDISKGWSSFCRRNFGRMILTSDASAAHIDGVWDEVKNIILPFLPNEYDINGEMADMDMFNAVDAALDNTSAYRDVYAEECHDDLVISLMDDITDLCEDPSLWHSFADKKKAEYDAKVKKIKQRYTEAMADVKKKTEQRYEKKLQNIKDNELKKIQDKKNRERHNKLWRRVERSYGWLTKHLFDVRKDLAWNIPEEFRQQVAQLIMDLDLQTQRSHDIEVYKNLLAGRPYQSKNTANLRALQGQLHKMAQEDSTYAMYDEFLSESINNLNESLGDRPLRQLTDDEIDSVGDILDAVVHMLKEHNKIVVAGAKQQIDTFASNIKLDMEDKAARYGSPSKEGGLVQRAQSFMSENMMTPGVAFNEAGGNLLTLYKDLRTSADTYWTRIRLISESFTDILAGNERQGKMFGVIGRRTTVPGSKLEALRGQASQREFTLSSGSKVKMTPAQIMSLYCLAKQPDALRHLEQGGAVMTSAAIDTFSDLIEQENNNLKGVQKVLKQKAKEAIVGRDITTDSTSFIMTRDDIINIVGTLTEEQRKIADEFQAMMNGDLKDWGNETSMKLWGVALFKQENYFPIPVKTTSVDRSEFATPSEISGNRVMNFGFTNARNAHANNPIYVGDIFQIMADHANKMALYSSYSVALANYDKVMRYRFRNEYGAVDGSVRESIKKAYGDEFLTVLSRFVNDVNGELAKTSDALSRLVDKSLARYKKAAIGLNIRVLVQQPTAIARSAYMIDAKYLAQGFKALDPKNIKSGLEEMHEHCPITWWKAEGNYQNDYTRSLESIMFNRNWTRTEAITMKMYGAADDVTWLVIWNAVKDETKALHPELAEGSEEFWKHCNERASEIFDETQVVDSVFHRTHMMRNTDTMSKLLTSFMAEPSKTYNMARSSVVKAYRLAKDGDKAGARNEIVKITTVLTLNAAAVSLAAALVDALRKKGADDDEDESYMELLIKNFRENFIDNMLIVPNNLPFLKDVKSLLDGWDTSNMALEGWEKLARGLTGKYNDRRSDIEKLFVGDMSLKEFLEGDFVGGLGYVTGIPAFNFFREFFSITDMLGFDVFASDGTEKKESSDDDWFEQHIVSGGTVKGSSDSGNGDDFWLIHDGTFIDNILNKMGKHLTAEEQKEWDYHQNVKDILKSVEDIDDEKEKQEKIWSTVTKGYTNSIEDYDLATIEEMRRTLKACGGDVDSFDEKVTKKVATAYKKCIGTGGRLDDMAKCKEYLLAHGYTEQDISHEIVCKSDAARELKKAFRMLDESKMVIAYRPLYEAGLTDADWYYLWENRNRLGAKETKSTGEFSNPIPAGVGTISSSFGERSAPTAGASTYHEGVDIAAPQGTEVKAADGGKIVYAGWNSGYGRQVAIQHDNGSITYYSHLSWYEARKGQRVIKGQYIGNVGSTGISTGPHLDFRVQNAEGVYVDPMNWLKY